MQKRKREKSRIIEVITGFLIILGTMGVLISFLFHMDYTQPGSGIEEDLSFLAENVSRQLISAYCWLSTGFLMLLLLPFYLIVFNRFQKGVHLFNGLLLTIMAYMFTRSGIDALHLAGYAKELSDTGEQILTDNENTLQALQLIHDIILFLKIGVTIYGAYLLTLSLARFREGRFSVMGSILIFIAGPVIITFTWLNPEHILLTAGLAAASVGMLFIGVFLVNKGMTIPPKE